MESSTPDVHSAAANTAPIARPSIPASRAYFEKIDGLRALAIGFVLVEHFAPSVGHRVTAGYFGVDLFFVISGFLVTNILLRSRGSFLSAYGKFLARRTLRIFPLYYLVLGFLLVVGYQPARDQILYLASYTYNYAWVALALPTGSLTHFWSLALEEQFYLIWPPIVLSLRRWPRILFTGTCLVASACFFQLVTSWFEAVVPYNYVGLYPRAGSLALGAIGALLQRRQVFLDALFRNLLLEWIVLVAMVATLITTYDLKLVVLGFGSLYLVLKAAHSEFQSIALNRLLVHPWMLHVGRVSYGIYILHVPIGLFLTDHLVAPWWMAIDFDGLGAFSWIRHALWVVLLPAYAAVSVAAATLSHRFLEKPILSLKDRFFR